MPKQLRDNWPSLLAFGVSIVVGVCGWVYARGGTEAKADKELEATQKQVDKHEMRIEAVEIKQRTDSERLIRVEEKLDAQGKTLERIESKLP